MELTPGYKLTEVGVIPEEWEVTTLGKCLLCRPKYGINAPAIAHSDQLPTYLRITDISDDGRYVPDPPVSVDSRRAADYCLAEGDIVFARTGASVGKSYRYTASDGALVFAGFLIRVRPDPHLLLPPFAAAYATTKSYWNWVRAMSMRSGQPGINGAEYARLLIPRPGLDEQHAIAETVGDVDALLASLDRLIAKKRGLKQAAMQQLLTGQTRLPGFCGDWRERPLGCAVQDLLAGVSVNSFEDALDTNQVDMRVARVLKTSAVDDGRFFPDQSKKVAPQDLARVSTKPRRDTIIISRMNTPDLVGECGYVAEGYPSLFLPDRLWMTVFTPGTELNPRWLSYLLSSRPMKARIKAMATGTSGSMKNISKDALLSLPIRFPEGPEQAGIAHVLSDMDSELAALEAQREKTRALKQAMMQELLTGRTRLV